MLRELNPNKKFIYWMNNNDMQIESDDIAQWWGANLPNIKQEIIIS